MRLKVEVWGAPSEEAQKPCRSILFVRAKSAMLIIWLYSKFTHYKANVHWTASSQSQSM